MRDLLYLRYLCSVVAIVTHDSDDRVPSLQGPGVHDLLYSHVRQQRAVEMGLHGELLP